MSRQQATTVLMRGGIDLETPLIASQPGRLLLAVNYEPTDRGYRRIAGYERYNGSVLPHKTSYALMRFVNGSTAILAGNTVTGQTSGNTGIAIAIATLESGTYGGGDAAGFVVLSSVSGAIGPYQDGENLQVAAATVAVADGTATARNAPSPTLDQAYLLAAHDYWRATIAKPAGSGAIRGVHGFSNDINYGSAIAFRDNAGATAGVMFDQSTGSGWSSVGLLSTLSFSANTVGQFTVGQTVTGGTSGATATIFEVVRQSGTWGTDAAGYLVIGGAAGTFQNEVITAPGVSATNAAAQAVITFPPGGRYRFVNSNVRGSTTSRRCYFVNGVGCAHEFNFTAANVHVVTPIRIPGITASQDKPTHVAVHKNHLFLGYPNGIIRHSSIGEPLEFLTTTGAGEIGFGDEITGMIIAAGVLVVFGRRQISYIVGSSASDFQMISISPDTGAGADSVQMVDTPYYFDGQMIRRLASTEALGGWKMGSVAPEVAEFWREQVAAGARVVASYRVQKRNQYVFILSTGVFAVVYLGRKRAEVGFLQGLYFLPTCSVEIDHTEGIFTEDVVLLGGDDGHVYLMDVGRSFDGASNDAYIVMAPVSIGGPRRNHRWHKAKVSIVPEGLTTAEPITLSYAAFYSFAGNVTPYQASQMIRDEAMTPAGLPGNLSGIADFLSGNEAEILLDGYGHNIALFIIEGAWEGTPPHTIDSITFYTTPRKQEG